MIVKTIEDLKKAIWYINDKIKTIENEVNQSIIRNL